ncbi:unknown [Ruminococcus sp. CAG:403]|nr:unknown [Ruminococcus sp. CAG:403]
MIDVSTDGDYEELTETYVYFLDEITEELLDYAGLKAVKED